MASKKPKPPSASSMIKAQTDANIMQQQYNAIGTSGGVSGPGGSMSKTLEYKTMKDQYGRDITVPVQSTQYQLSEQNQGLYDTAGNLAGTAQANLGRYAEGPDMYSTVFGENAGDGGLAAIEGKLAGLQERRLNPQLEQQRRAQDELNAARGITMGSALGDRAAMNLAQQQNDARNSLYTSAFSTAANTVANERAQRMAAMQGDRNFNMGLMQGGLGARGAIQGQAFGMPNQNYGVNIGGVNAAGAMQQAYQNKQNQYENQVGIKDLMGLGGQLGAAYLTGGSSMLA